MKLFNLFLIYIIIICFGLVISCSTTILLEEPEINISLADKNMVVINEVASIGEYEFIELYNTMDYPIKLGEGWVLDDNGENYIDGSRALNVPKGTIIPRNGYLVICPFEEKDANEVLNNINIPETALLDISFSINNEDTINLYHGIQLVDTITWETDVNSIGRRSKAPFEVTPLLKPTPGFENISELQSNADFGIIINEINSSGDDYIEIFNKSDHDFSFSKGEWTLEDIQKKNHIFIPSEIIIESKGFLIIYPAKKTLEIIAMGNNFMLENTDSGYKLGSSDSVFLRKDGVIIDSQSWSNHVNSAGRYPDGGGDWVYIMSQTAGLPNLLVSE